MAFPKWSIADLECSGAMAGANGPATTVLVVICIVKAEVTIVE